MARPKKVETKPVVSANDVFITSTVHVPGSLPYEIKIQIKNAKGNVLASQFKPNTFASRLVAGLNQFGKLEIK